MLSTGRLHKLASHKIWLTCKLTVEGHGDIKTSSLILSLQRIFKKLGGRLN